MAQSHRPVAIVDSETLEVKASSAALIVARAEAAASRARGVPRGYWISLNWHWRSWRVRRRRMNSQPKCPRAKTTKAASAHAQAAVTPWRLCARPPLL